ncbi:MAG: DUF5615 family PIN-like protein [Chloroflexota bacterium]|nr:DUF5615 family PIN-like protein [Chloroflexota bacterium]
MPSPRFLLDEHIPHSVRDQLLRLDDRLDILVIGHPLAPKKGTLDDEILTWIEETGYILVTSNRRTIPIHVRDHFEVGGHIPGIILLRRGASLGEIIEQLYLLWAASDAEEYLDRILYIPM